MFQPNGIIRCNAGHDVPFVNNYGVWKDEFRELGLESTLDVSWDDAMCYFGENQEVRVGRGYGRYARSLSLGLRADELASDIPILPPALSS